MDKRQMVCERRSLVVHIDEEESVTVQQSYVRGRHAVPYLTPPWMAAPMAA